MFQESMRQSSSQEEFFEPFEFSCNILTPPNIDMSCLSFPLMCQSSEYGFTSSADEEASTSEFRNSSFHTFPSQIHKVEKQGSSICATATSTDAQNTRKKRIKWTDDLHRQFVKCVKYLGGPEKATPKEILKMMHSDILTILQVKSHLQKYRATMHMQKYLHERCDQRSDRTDNLTRLHEKIHVQIKKAMQLQLDFKRSLNEQLEIQQNIEVLIEDQRKQLNLIFDQKNHKSNMSAIHTASSNDTNLG